MFPRYPSKHNIVLRTSTEINFGRVERFLRITGIRNHEIVTTSSSRETGISE